MQDRGSPIVQHPPRRRRRYRRRPRCPAATRPVRAGGATQAMRPERLVVAERQHHRRNPRSQHRTGGADAAVMHCHRYLREQPIVRCLLQLEEALGTSIPADASPPQRVGQPDRPDASPPASARHTAACRAAAWPAPAGLRRCRSRSATGVGVLRCRSHRSDAARTGEHRIGQMVRRQLCSAGPSRQAGAVVLRERTQTHCPLQREQRRTCRCVVARRRWGNTLPASAKACRSHGIRQWHRGRSGGTPHPAAQLCRGPSLQCIACGGETQRRATASAAARSASAQRFVGQVGVTGQPCFQCVAQFLCALGR